MKTSLKVMLACLLSILGATSMMAAAVDIPTAANIDLNNAVLTNCKVENDGRDVGSTRNGSVISLTLNNTTEQAYLISLLTGASKLTADYEVKVVDATNAEVMTTTMHVLNTGSWTPSTQQKIYIPTIPAGTYTLSLTCVSTTGSYAGNLGSVNIEACNYDVVPGTLDIKDKGIYDGPQYESANQNIGYVQNNGTATYNFVCNKDAYYKFFMDITRYNVSTIDFEITDYTTHETITQTVDIPDVSNYTEAELLEAIHLSAGVVSMKLTFHNGGGWVCNFKNPKWVFQAEKVAGVSKLKVNGGDVEAGEDTDWIKYLSKNYNDANTTISFALLDGTVAVTAVDDNDAAVTVTDNGGNTYSIPTPAQGASTTVSIVLTPNGDAVALQTNYSVKITHLGDILVKELYVDGIKIDDSYVSAINTADAFTATFANTFTQQPTVSALINDDKTVNGTGAISGTSAAYTFVGGDSSDTRTFTLNIEGIHIYTIGANDESHSIAPGTGITTDGVWSDGQVTLNGSGDWAFKLKPGDYTLTFPSNWQVKQIKFGKSADNYASTGYISAASSDGATVYVPFDTRLIQGNERDFYVNIDNHVAGTPFNFTLTGCSQATFRTIEIVYEEVSVATAPTLVSSTVTSTVGKNHAVIALTFDHAVTAANATCNNQAVRITGLGSTTLYCSVWDLDYDKEYTLTIPAAGLADAYGNKNAETITATFSTGEKAVVDLSIADYTVTTVAELRAAVTAANGTNDRTVIIIKNGDYDLGTEPLVLKNNVSIIGESRDGVLIHGLRDGISNPVVDCRGGVDAYLENMTIRNDYDFRQTLKGVSVALRGGERTICYHVTMQANQDTFVTWESGYILECDIHGTVDFICGGGDYLFERCNIILENRGGNCITAPNTSEVNQWGYVFVDCTVTKAEGATAVVDGGYSLGRPWQNSPRCNYINTTFEVLPSAAGWAGMSKDLNTYFYEYGSKKADGTLIDLSTRSVAACSSANGNYTPVLTAAEAAEYTMYNILGGNNSWNPIDMFQNVVTVDIVGNDFVTFSSDKAVAIPADVTAYYLAMAGNDVALLEEIETGYIPANCGVVLNNADTEDKHIVFEIVEVTVEAIDGNLLVAGPTLAEAGDYVLAQPEGKPLGFYSLNNGGNVPLGKAFLPKSNIQQSGAAHAPALRVIFNEEATGIESVAIDRMSDDNLYNLQGQKVNANYKGIVIKNGKKVVNK